MKTFAIETLGCKVNQYESQQIRELLERHHLVHCPGPGTADLVVVNTCCVTHVASSKSRQCIRRALKTHPGAQVIVAGCLPVGQADELGFFEGNVAVVPEKDQLAAVLSALVAGKGQSKTRNIHKIKSKNDLPVTEETSPDKTDTRCSQLDVIHTFEGQSRAFLKIQDGCDGYCTYCIIPKIRTNVCNKDVKSVLEEARNLTEAGHREIVLTGIFLGAYGRSTVRRKRWEGGDSLLAGLVDRVAEAVSPVRVRLSSLEPGDVTEKLLDVMAGRENVMPHLHLPLQSGSEAVLKRMGRQYTLEQYRGAVTAARQRLDRPAITTDIIVGFPGETEDDFAETLRVAREMAFSKIHVFSYSDRAGTAAEEMKPKVSPEVIKRRAKELGELDRRLQKEFRRQFAGEKCVMIVEEEGPPAKGRCERYFPVTAPDPVRAEKGSLQEVFVAADEVDEGKIVDNEEMES